jgi:hypothetical protein
MKKTTWAMLVLLLVLGLFPLTSQAAPLKNLSWRAEYYDNPTLSGQPKLSRYEDVLSHDWGYDSPSDDIPVDHFSARYTQTRHFEKGTYLFVFDVDDGIRVWFDGQLVLDKWSVGKKTNLKVKVYVDKTGNHEMQVAYFENTQKASIHLEPIQLGGEGDIVGSWRGEYFRNRNLEGDPVVVRQDGKIDFDWNSGSPDSRIPRDNFSVRWTRSIYLKAGTYQLRIQHDDGMRVYVNGEMVYESWKDQSVSYTTRKVKLETGYHAFQVEYYEHLNNAIAKMVIDGDPGNYTDNGDDGDDGDDGDSGGDIVVVDNLSSGFEWGGPLSNRFVGWGGCYRTDYFWTYNSMSRPVNSGKWTPSLDAGDYEVFTFIPAENATTRSARYRIHHNGTRSDRVVNQAIYYNVWVSLGTYEFSGNGNEYVLLYDNTSEVSGSTQIAFDALKFVPR